MTFISRIFGFIRDVVLARTFGANIYTDAFFVAFRLPNLLRRFFAEGAFSQSFVPVLSEYKARRREEVKELVARTSGTLGLILLVVCSVGVLSAELIISLFAPGYIYQNETEKFELAVEMLRLTFPYLFLISMTAVSGAILNTYGRFAIPAFTPVLLNVSLISSAVLLREHLQEPVMALAWGVLIAGVAQLTFQLPFLARISLLPLPKLGFSDSGVRRIGGLMLPAIFGASVSQINLLLDTLLASFLETGSLSWLYYSDRLLELPLALFGITIATVILPGLSREYSEKSPQAFSDTLNWALKLVLVFGVPASFALVLLSRELIAVLFFIGEMTVRDVTMAGWSLAAYGFGLLGHIWVKVLAPGYFARQDTRTPVRYGVISLIANMILNLMLIWHLKHVGLALATSLSAFLNAGLLFVGLKRTGILKLETGWGMFLMKIFLAAAVMSIALYYCVPDMDFWLAEDFFIRLGCMLLICGAGGVTYAAVLVVLGINVKQLAR